MNRKLDRKDGYLTNRKLDKNKWVLNIKSSEKDGCWTNRKLDLDRKIMGIGR